MKTKTNKFKRFSIEVRDGQLNFYKFRSANENQKEEESQKEDKRASHSLEHVHVMFGAIEKDSVTK